MLALSHFSLGVFIGTSLVLHLLSDLTLEFKPLNVPFLHVITLHWKSSISCHNPCSQHYSTEHRTCRINGICSQSDAQCLLMLLTVMPVRLMDQYNVSSHYGKEDIPPSIISSINRTTASMHATGSAESHSCAFLLQKRSISQNWQYKDVLRKIMNNQCHACILEGITI